MKNILNHRKEDQFDKRNWPHAIILVKAEKKNNIGWCIIPNSWKSGNRILINIRDGF